MVHIFKENIACALSKACEHDADNDAFDLAEAGANIVRRDMFKMKNQFKPTEEEPVPVSLLALVAMVINGPNIEAQSSSSLMPQLFLPLHSY